MAEPAISDPRSDNHRIENSISGEGGHETGYESLVRPTSDGLSSLTLLVGGVTCALCIQKIESALASEGDVKVARLNFGARRLYIEWHGAAKRANDFVRLVEALGYRVHPYDEGSVEARKKSEERFLLLCLGVAGFAMGNVMLLSVGVWSTSAETMGVATRDLLHIISAMIALPAIMFSGRPFFRSAYRVLRKGHSNMDVPISLALILTSGVSLFEIIRHGEHVYFDSAIMLTFFLLVGKYLDFKARESARSSAHDLLQSFQGFANVVEGKKMRRVLIRDLKEGMRVFVAVGEKIPVDGCVQDGRSQVDTSLVTGETLPRDIQCGDFVYAGTTNISAPIYLDVVKAADDSLLADIVRLMDKAGQAQAAYTRIADRAARLYTPVVHSLAFVTFIGWVFLGGMVWQDALLIAITVLIITCPCALGLAVPVVQVLATGRLMRRGVFVKSGDALERLASIDRIVFDKTGTLTIGRPALIGQYEEESLCLAASMAQHSSHPLSKALVRDYEGDLCDLEDVREHEGRGVSAIYKEENVKIGSRDFCGVHAAKNTADSFLEVWLVVEGKKPVRFVFEDCVREDAAHIVESFKVQGLGVALISGDRQSAVDAAAEQAGIDEIYAEKTPVQKYDLVEGWQIGGQRVLMVGDGLNDAPVLAGSDISIAPGTAIDMAQNAADIVFMGDELSPVYEVYKTAKRSQKLVKQNFVLAVLYNLIAIPLAISGYVTPFIAALAMSGSSLLVIANSFRLR